MTTIKDTQGQGEAQAQLDSIIEMVEALEAAQAADDDDAIEAAEAAISEDPLSVQVRSGWTTPGATLAPEDYEILLCWGGPAARIIGELNEYCEPDTAVIESQDWGTAWTPLVISDEDNEKLLTYVRQFYFSA